MICLPTIVVRKRSCEGFTLIEVMMAISIIAILTVITFTAYSSVQKNSRDAKRKSDLGAIQSALEQYRADQHNYPVAGNVGIGNLATYSPTSPLMNPAGNVNYLNRYPVDPKYSSSTGCSGSPCYKYLYVPGPLADCTNTGSNLCTGYCLYASVEGSTSMVSGCSHPYFNYSISAP